MDIKELSEDIGKTVITESCAAKLEKRRPYSAVMTPLHAIYAKFVHTACNENCFSKSEYYSNRCMRSLCFVRWLVLNGYAQFEDNEIAQSIVEEEGGK